MEVFINNLKILKNITSEDLHFQQNLLKNLTFSKLYLEDLLNYVTESLLNSTLFCDDFLNFTVICLSNY